MSQNSRPRGYKLKPGALLFVQYISHGRVEEMRDDLMSHFIRVTVIEVHAGVLIRLLAPFHQLDSVLICELSDR